MSRMQRYQDDVQELTTRAVGIAWHPDTFTRWELLTELFGDCGSAAVIYADPAAVAVLFVHAVAEAYAAAFVMQREVAA